MCRQDDHLRFYAIEPGKEHHVAHITATATATGKIAVSVGVQSITLSANA